MSNALTTLAHIAAGAAEYSETARKYGFDGADALNEIEEIARQAGQRIRDVPPGSCILVAAILMQDMVCEDVLDLAENNLAMVLRDRGPARAVRAKLQGFVSIYGDPDGPDSAHAASCAEGEAYDRCQSIVRRIDLKHGAA